MFTCYAADISEFVFDPCGIFYLSKLAGIELFDHCCDSDQCHRDAEFVLLCRTGGLLDSFGGL